MGMWLRQSTASQEVAIGPFLDDTDAKTPETGLTIANTDIKLWKDGATSEANKNSGGATHMASGRYYCVLDATDTNTLGKLELNVHVSGALPVRREFMVVPAMVYDSLILGTDRFDANVTHLVDQVVTAAAGVTFPAVIPSQQNIIDAFADDSGTAQAGSASSITLRAGASAVDNFYAGAIVNLTGGTGAGQSRKINSYVGSTRVAGLDSNWVTAPDNTTTYIVIGRSV